MWKINAHVPQPRKQPNFQKDNECKRKKAVPRARNDQFEGPGRVKQAAQDGLRLWARSPAMQNERVHFEGSLAHFVMILLGSFVACGFAGQVAGHAK